MAEPVPLTVPRIVLPGFELRPWRIADASALAANANNPKIAANLRDRFPHPYTEEAARTYLAGVSQPGRPIFAIEVAGEAVGGIGFHPQEDIHRLSFEVGFWLAEQHWGKGIASAGVRAATDWALGTLDLQRIFAMVFASNAASARVLEKAGFEREGLLRRAAVKHGQIFDLLLYARLAR